jgi:Cu-Zn family superoxide dismutase
MLGQKPWILLAVLLLAGCDGSGRDPLDARDDDSGEATEASRDPEADPAANATIEPKSGSRVEGEAFLAQRDGRVSVAVRIFNAPPGGHAVHLHEKGDCSAPDASSAGEHWNPDGKPHGQRGGDGAFHAGDLGNVEIGPDGTGSLNLEIEDWSLGSGGPDDPIGKAIVVHAKPDDFVTQPDGAGGQKIGCGVIESGGKRT